MESLERLVERTPASRNRAADLYRAGALVVVMLGHWVMQGVYVDDSGTLRRLGLLGIAPWTHPFTWPLQVMPIFFLVGGYANTRSWRRAQAAGTTYGTWLEVRARRLTRPVVPLMVFWLAAGPGATALGLGPDWLRVAGLASLVPTWFLATYVVIVAMTPVWDRVWRRMGLVAVPLGVVLLGLADLLTVRVLHEGLLQGLVAIIHVLLVWGTVTVLGHAWLDGTVTRAGAVAIAAAGLAGAALLVRLGPYGVSMVGVDGYGLDNTDPPKVTLLLLGLGQCGIAIALAPWISRLLERPRLWRLTVLLNSRIMTLYLWHLTAVGVLAAVSLWLGGLGLRLTPASAEWWWTRPLWFAVLAALTVGCALVFGRWEQPLPPPTARVPTWEPVTQVVLTCVGLGLLALHGISDREGNVHWWLPLLPLLGYWIGLRHRSGRTGPAS